MQRQLLRRGGRLDAVGSGSAACPAWKRQHCSPTWGQVEAPDGRLDEGGGAGLAVATLGGVTEATGAPQAPAEALIPVWRDGGRGRPRGWGPRGMGALVCTGGDQALTATRGRREKARLQAGRGLAGHHARGTRTCGTQTQRRDRERLWHRRGSVLRVTPHLAPLHRWPRPRPPGRRTGGAASRPGSGPRPCRGRRSAAGAPSWRRGCSCRRRCCERRVSCGHGCHAGRAGACAPPCFPHPVLARTRAAP